MGDEIIWVRIKPRNEKKGLRLRRLLAYGHRFDEEKGWYMITSHLQWEGRRVNIGEYLSHFRNIQDDEDSPLAFDVCTEAEAKAIERAERQKAEIKAYASKPVDLTTSDLRRGTTEVADDEPSNDNGVRQTDITVPRKRGRPRKNVAT